MSTIALMYHGIHGDEHPLADIKLEDRPYALSVQLFREHLTVLADKDVVLTFDDGDLGWYLYALPILAEVQRTAIFFVTPELIGTSGYCSWDQLRSLSEHGHQIGTHGLSHAFLPDLDEQQCLHELVHSKSLLEQHTGVAVTALSFPGGRFGARELRLARDAGYQHCYTSVPGHITAQDFCPARVAVRASNSAQWVLQLVNESKSVWWPMLLSYRLKKLLKSLLGNRGYHELYRIIRG